MEYSILAEVDEVVWACLLNAHRPSALSAPLVATAGWLVGADICTEEDVDQTQRSEEYAA